MKIKIQTKLNSKVTIELMLIFICVEKFLEWTGFPHFIIFSLDLANLYLFINSLLSFSVNQYNIKRTLNPIIVTQVIIIFTGVFVALVNGVRIILIAWAIRNLCRFWIFFYACILFLKESDVKNVFNIFEKIYFINLIVMFIQYAFFGYKQDFLGGLFGVEAGANANCNVFFLIVCTYEISSWFNKKEGTVKAIFILITAIIAAAFAELKFFFVELAAIIALIFMIDCFLKGSFKNFVRAFLVVAFAGVILLIGIRIMGEMYPTFANYFTLEQFLYNNTRASGYTGHGDLNRLTAIMTINSDVFSNMDVIKFFGMGLGSAEYSSWSAMTSWFYNEYSYLHYYWFSDAWMYLENGYLGLFLYPLGFILNGIWGIYMLRKDHKKKHGYSSVIVTGSVLSFMTLGLYLYNQSLRLECAYLLYFCFAAMAVEIYNTNSRKEPCAC